MFSVLLVITVKWVIGSHCKSLLFPCCPLTEDLRLTGCLRLGATRRPLQSNPLIILPLLIKASLICAVKVFDKKVKDEKIIVIQPVTWALQDFKHIFTYECSFTISSDLRINGTSLMCLCPGQSLQADFQFWHTITTLSQQNQGLLLLWETKTPAELPSYLTCIV